MKIAAIEDRAIIIDILTKSFDANLSVNHIVKQGSQRISRIQHLMEYSVNVCLRYGEVIISDDKKSCALISYPHMRRITFESIWLDIMLAVQVIGFSGILRAMKREALMNNISTRVGGVCSCRRLYGKQEILTFRFIWKLQP